MARTAAHRISARGRSLVFASSTVETAASAACLTNEESLPLRSSGHLGRKTRVRPPVRTSGGPAAFDIFTVSGGNGFAQVIWCVLPALRVRSPGEAARSFAGGIKSRDIVICGQDVAGLTSWCLFVSSIYRKQVGESACTHWKGNSHRPGGARTSASVQFPWASECMQQASTEP